MLLFVAIGGFGVLRKGLTPRVSGSHANRFGWQEESELYGGLGQNLYVLR